MMGIIAISDRASWLAERKRHLQASEAAAVLGCSPWMTADQLFDLKTGRAEEKDIGDSPAIQRGVASEPLVRALVPIDLPEMTVTAYRQYDIRTPDDPSCAFMGATLDGELVDDDGDPGILECKTGSFTGQKDLERKGWAGDRIPDHYYTQVLHQLACWEEARFVLVAARLTCDWYRGDDPQRMPAIRTIYVRFDRDKRLEEDIAYLKDEERKFWGYVLQDKRPPLAINANVRSF